MMLQVVAALPVGRERGEPLDAFAAAPLHLQDVRNRMRGPQVAGVELYGAASRRLGGEVVADLLLREAAAREYRPNSPGCPPTNAGITRSTEATMSCGLPSQKLTKCARRNATTSCGCVAQNRLPRREGAIELAVGPCGQGGNVAALARRGARGERLRGSRRVDGDGNDGLLEPEHGEVALHAMRERKVRIGLHYGVETGGRIGSERQVAGDEIVVSSGRPGAGRRDGQATDIEMHGVLPSRRGTLRVRAWSAWQSARHTRKRAKPVFLVV